MIKPHESADESEMNTIKVFLSDKLITCDAIIPICLEIKTRHPNCRFAFFLNSPNQYLVIKQNETLNNALKKIDAELYVFGIFNKFRRFKLNRKLVILAQLSHIIFQTFFYKTYFFHFKKLSFFPFSLLQKLNPSRTIYFQPNAWGVPTKLREIDDLIGNRTQLPAPKAERVFVGYNESWINRHKTAASSTFFLIAPPRLQSSWKLFLTEQKKLHSQRFYQKVPDSVVFGIVLGYFGKLDLVKDEKSMETCFIETLNSIFEVCPTARVYLKPHIITDIYKLESLISTFKDFDVQITYLHPALLAHFSNAVICNAYSSAMPDAFFENVVTIEYSEYGPKALELSGNQSVEPDYIDHFFNKQPNKLKELLREICDGKDVRTKKRVSEALNNEKQERFFDLFM